MAAATAAHERWRLARQHGAAPENEHFAVEQCASDFLSGGLNEPSERRPRDAHPPGRIVVVKPFRVGQSKRLELVQSDLDLLQAMSRDAGGLEPGAAWLAAHEPAFAWTGHSLTPYLGRPRRSPL
jgi:hypothetical protein